RHDGEWRQSLTSPCRQRQKASAFHNTTYPSPHYYPIVGPNSLCVAAVTSPLNLKFKQLPACLFEKPLLPNGS
ncbi:hypothetical protein HAX54_051981, partial [Datura stramonium]|nr:hypothetical protein [Datura stramonium]